MKNQLIEYIYDDRLSVSPQIENIVGARPYGSIRYKRKTLGEHVKTTVSGVNANIRFHHVNSDDGLKKILQSINPEKSLLFYHPAWIVPIKNQIQIQLEKAILAKSNLKYKVGKKEAFYFFFQERNIEKYIVSQHEDLECLTISLDDYCIDISDYQSCLSFFSGAFEARFFNQVIGSHNFVTKSSSNIQKMKAEHDYYYLIPPEMQYWFVQPFEYKESELVSSYKMERLFFSDCALQWIHDAFTEEEFDKFLRKVFFFIQQRKSDVSNKGKTLFKLREDLYEKKVQSRLAQLKAHGTYEKLNHYIKISTEYNGLDEIFAHYFRLYGACQTESVKDELHRWPVVGHGDLCFSNILYDKNTQLLRLIDPKGSISIEDIWTDPYYDIAKLSHSILGDYDLINNDSFTISLRQDLIVELILDKNVNDKRQLKMLFKQILEQNNFDYYKVRLFETSLFLSMLPLHIDHEKKVLGFILNAISILKELDAYESK